MESQNLVQVALDKDLVQKLLDGLYNGAKGKALKVVIDTDKNYHIESRGLSILMEINEAGTHVTGIRVQNDRQFAIISDGILERLRLNTFADNVAWELRDKYSPVFHSLADNIVIFARAYWNPSIDDHL